MSRVIPACPNADCPDYRVPMVPGRTRRDQAIWHCLHCDRTAPRTERPPGRTGLWYHLHRAEEKKDGEESVSGPA